MTSTETTRDWPEAGGDPHGIEPSLPHLFSAAAFLVLGFAVDLAQFRQVVGRVAPDIDDRSVWLIAAGASAVALYMMVEAGRMDAQRRWSSSGRHGRGAVWLLVAVWALLGVVATYVRLTVLPTDATTGGFGTADTLGTAGGFGSAAAPVTTTWQLGPITMHPSELPLALLMLMLYTAVGIGAYLFGKRMHRPLLTDLRRARRREARARRRLAYRLGPHYHRSANLAARSHRLDQIESHHQVKRAETALAAALAEHDAAVAHQAQTGAELMILEWQLVEAGAELGAAGRVSQAQLELVTVAGETAKQHARALLHRHLANPAQTIKHSDALGPYQRPEA